MKRVETDKNASVLENCKSRLVGCGNFETTEGLRASSPDGDVDSQLFDVRVLRLTSSFTHDFHEWI